MKKYKVYQLTDPNTLEVRYVGVTQRTLKERLSQHLWEATKSGKTPKHLWIKNLLEQQAKPQISLLEECDEHDWREKECKWLSHFSSLTNIRPGGAGLITGRSSEGIKKSADAHKKPICQFSIKGEFIQEWDSTSTASKTLGIKRSQIHNALAKRSKSAGMYCWCPLNEKDTFIPNIKHSHSLQGKFIKKPVRVVDLQNKEHRFDSIAETAQHVSYSESFLSLVLAGTRRHNYKTFLLIEYIENYDIV